MAPMLVEASCLRAQSRPVAVQKLNPYLSSQAADSVASSAQDWQELCILDDKLKRCLLCLPGASIGETNSHIDRSPSRLAEDLRNDCAHLWYREEHPEWLAFQVLERIEIRERQMHVAQWLIRNVDAMERDCEERGAIVQLNMGEGKTRVILPMLVMALNGRGMPEVIRLNFLGSLLPDAVACFRSMLTGVQVEEGSAETCVPCMHSCIPRHIETFATQAVLVNHHSRHHAEP
jgi:hypothetical protein